MIAKFAYLVPALVVSFLLVGSNPSFAQSNPCAGNNPCAASKQSNRFAGKMVSNLIFPLSCARLVSEYSAVHYRNLWKDSEVMPIFPMVHVRLTPLLQWLALPALTLILLNRDFKSMLKQRVLTSGARIGTKLTAP